MNKYQKVLITLICVICGSMAGAAVWPSDCDVNHDRAVNAVDIQMVTNAALSLPNQGATDVNHDIQVDATDVQAVINMTLGNERPRLAILKLPPYGSSDGYVGGPVYPMNENSDAWRIALYSRVPGSNEFTLLSPDTLTPIDDKDGRWAQTVSVDQNWDGKCKEFLAFFLPAASAAEAPTSSVGEPIVKGAVDMARAERKPTVQISTPSVIAGVDGFTNCDHRSYGVMCYVQYGPENGGRVYPQPLSDPTGSNYLAPINPNGTFHVPLDQVSFGSVVTDYDPSKGAVVLTQIMPLDADYVDAWPEFVDNLGLNFYDQVAQVTAPVMPFVR